MSESLVFCRRSVVSSDLFRAVKDAVRTAAADLAVFLFVSRTGLVISFRPLQHLASPCPWEESAWAVSLFIEATALRRVGSGAKTFFGHCLRRVGLGAKTYRSLRLHFNLATAPRRVGLGTNTPP